MLIFMVPFHGGGGVAVTSLFAGEADSPRVGVVDLAHCRPPLKHVNLASCGISHLWTSHVEEIIFLAGQLCGSHQLTKQTLGIPCAIFTGVHLAVDL